MSINATSLAAGVGASVENVQFASSAQNLPRKTLIIGTHLPSASGVVENTPLRVLSPEDAGARFGFGSMLERLVAQSFAGSGGVETWVSPQAEASGAAAAAGSIDFTGSASVLAGTLSLYIAANLVPVNLTAAMTAAQIATAVAAAINAVPWVHVTAAVDGTTAGKVDLTAKSKGPWGNGVTLALNLGFGQALPGGATVAVTAMSGGTGIPSIADALNGLGTGDDANDQWFTDVCHGYGLDTGTLDAISTYVGVGNAATGLYSNTVSRPFRVPTGDTGAGSGGFTTLTTLSGNRLIDRANGIIAVPGSRSHPSEIAAVALGVMAAVNQNVVAQSYNGLQLPGIDPGVYADRWTSDYNNRDLAVKSGISPTRVIAGVVYLQNVVTFYRPVNVPVSSNGYRSMRNISILQNMLFNERLNFSQDKWQGVSIVADTSAVSSTIDRQKARDIDSVIDDLMALAYAFEAKAWIYEAQFTIDRLKLSGAVTIRDGANGFESVLSVILSGEGGILDTKTQFDTSLAVLTNG